VTVSLVVAGRRRLAGRPRGGRRLVPPVVGAARDGIL
jgi:hypothetical protein